MKTIHTETQSSFEERCIASRHGLTRAQIIYSAGLVNTDHRAIHLAMTDYELCCLYEDPVRFLAAVPLTPHCETALHQQLDYQRVNQARDYRRTDFYGLPAVVQELTRRPWARSWLSSDIFLSIVDARLVSRELYPGDSEMLRYRHMSATSIEHKNVLKAAMAAAAWLTMFSRVVLSRWNNGLYGCLDRGDYSIFLDGPVAGCVVDRQKAKTVYRLGEWQRRDIKRYNAYTVNDRKEAT